MICFSFIPAVVSILCICASFNSGINVELKGIFRLSHAEYVEIRTHRISYLILTKTNISFCLTCWTTESKVSLWSSWGDLMNMILISSLPNSQSLSLFVFRNRQCDTQTELWYIYSITLSQRFNQYLDLWARLQHILSPTPAWRTLGEIYSSDWT